MNKSEMSMYKIHTVLNQTPFTFWGKYRRDLEKPNWHYYETDRGEIYHFRKEHMVCVEEVK